MFKFTKEMYLKKIEEALTTPIEQLNPANMDGVDLKRILEARKGREVRPMRMPAQ